MEVSSIFSGITASMFDDIVTAITSTFGVVVAVSVPLVALRKGWSFLIGNIKKA